MIYKYYNLYIILYKFYNCRSTSGGDADLIGRVYVIIVVIIVPCECLRPKSPEA